MASLLRLAMDSADKPAPVAHVSATGAGRRYIAFVLRTSDYGTGYATTVKGSFIPSSKWLPTWQENSTMPAGYGLVKV